MSEEKKHSEPEVIQPSQVSEEEKLTDIEVILKHLKNGNIVREYKDTYTGACGPKVIGGETLRVSILPIMLMKDDKALFTKLSTLPLLANSSQPPMCDFSTRLVFNEKYAEDRERLRQRMQNMADRESINLNYNDPKEWYTPTANYKYATISYRIDVTTQLHKDCVAAGLIKDSSNGYKYVGEVREIIASGVSDLLPPEIGNEVAKYHT